MDAADRVEAVIRDALALEVPNHDADLIAQGLLDSLALVSLIVEIEKEFSIQLPLDDFDPDRFRSVETIAAFVTESAAR